MQFEWPLVNSNCLELMQVFMTYGFVSILKGRSHSDLTINSVTTILRQRTDLQEIQDKLGMKWHNNTAIGGFIPV